MELEITYTFNTKIEERVYSFSAKASTARDAAKKVIDDLQQIIGQIDLKTA